MPTYLDMQQLSPEWRARRRGCITASSAEKLFGTKAARRKYLCELAAQRLVDERTESFRGVYWTDRGLDLEIEARAAVAFEIGEEVQQVGLCVSDLSKWFVCSPDGLIGSDIVLQIKCPAPQTHVAYALDNTLLVKDYQDQLHAELICTSRYEALIVSYCPGMRMVLRFLQLEDNERDAMSVKIREALADVEQIIERVKL